jgi:hypothetical protein
MIDDHQSYLVVSLPETEYGRAFFSILKEELEELEKCLEISGKICDNPIREDFRYQMGLIEGYKRVLRKPQEIKENYQKGETQ